MGRGLALAFLSGRWTREEMLERAGQALDEAAPWLDEVVGRVLAAFPEMPVDGDAALVDLLCGDPKVLGAVLGPDRKVRIRRWLIPEATMVPVGGPPAGFPVLAIPSPGELAQLLELSTAELDWFADLRGINAKARGQRLRHYRYQWVRKASGGYRVLEAPKPRLKALQRRLLREVIAPVPVAPSAHGFVRGRGVRSFVQPHVGRAVVVRLDLQDFFASVSRARVAATFRRVGYPRSVARALAGLCTAATPDAVLAAHPREGVDLSQRFLANARLRDPHLPQGAPTSPALANLAAWRLDRRLSALGEGFGARYTRYADDLAFSGDLSFERALPFFLPRAAAIAIEEGFRVNHRKTRIMRRGRRQHLVGLVVNERPNVARKESDDLRALLHNAARLGPESQNREGLVAFRAHLEGRIAWIASINPAKGARLRALFDRIPWERRLRP